MQKDNFRIIHYKNEHSEIVPIKINKKINNLDDLFKLLLKCYCKETSYPKCQKDYNVKYSPTYGQCAVTAMIVNDYFGGTIHKVRLEDGVTHYFNKINNVYIDLTSDQFSLLKIDINYENNEVIPREYCLENQDTMNRYNLLNKKLNDILK